MKLKLYITLTFISLLMVSCKKKDENKTNALTITTTTGMLADAVKNIVQDKATVISLMGPGVDPHLYKATQGDLKRLTEADIVFYNGLHLEGKMAEVLEKMKRNRTVVAVAENIPVDSLRLTEEGVADPHVWFDVMLWKNVVETISNQIQKSDSLNATFYKTQTEIYLSKLDSLHAFVKKEIESIPPTQRILITAHDAFGYFGDAYGIEVHGLQGISTVSEFGLNDVKSLTDFIITHKIKAIFVESSVSDKSMQAVLQGCQAKGWPVVIGGNLFSDAMGEKGTPEGTYIGMVKHNTRTIVNALR
ncbi:MAG: zinc ABC transporter substrate-binding protein [Cyclobacteriaceae bacterium]|jgi:manganese/zinc/iron transport system substrate-binding protein|nr:zinc ABC transporter substrate-binding protein [Cyclobacteriaceae bacterium]